MLGFLSDFISDEYKAQASNLHVWEIAIIRKKYSCVATPGNVDGKVAAQRIIELSHDPTPPCVMSPLSHQSPLTTCTWSSFQARSPISTVSYWAIIMSCQRARQHDSLKQSLSWSSRSWLWFNIRLQSAVLVAQTDTLAESGHASSKLLMGDKAGITGIWSSLHQHLLIGWCTAVSNWLSDNITVFQRTSAVLGVQSDHAHW